MKKYILLAGIMCLSVANAYAVPILSDDFDASASTFTFDGTSPGATTATDGELTAVNGVVVAFSVGDVVAPGYYDGADSSVIRFDFNSLMSAIGLDFYANNQDATLSVYDSSDLLIESLTIARSDQFACGGFGCGFVGIDVGSNLISWATIDTPLNGDEIMVDNIKYQASASVSEPGSWALLCLSLVGLRVLRKSKNV